MSNAVGFLGGVIFQCIFFLSFQIDKARPIVPGSRIYTTNFKHRIFHLPITVVETNGASHNLMVVKSNVAYFLAVPSAEK